MSAPSFRKPQQTSPSHLLLSLLQSWVDSLWEPQDKVGGALACCGTRAYGEGFHRGSKHPKVWMWPSMTPDTLPYLKGSHRGGCPQAHTATSPTGSRAALPHACLRHFALLHSGTLTRNGSLFALPSSPGVASICGMSVPPGTMSRAQFKQKGSAGSLGSRSDPSPTGRVLGKEAPAEQLRGFANEVTSRRLKASQAPSIKFLTRKIVCPFLCNTPLGFFIMTSFPLVILERLYNCKSVIESNRISFGAWNVLCHGRSFRVK